MMTNPQRYALMEGEMVPATNGQWVEWDDYLVRTGALADKIDSLDDELTCLKQKVL